MGLDLDPVLAPVSRPPIALSRSGWHSPRAPTVAASPILKAAGINDAPGTIYYLERRLGDRGLVLICTGLV